MEAGNDIKATNFRGTLSAAIFKVMRKELTVSEATAIAVLAKELNASVQAEVAAAKCAAKLKSEGHDFGNVARFGEAVVAALADEPAEK